jgi:type IV pilus assembly protein PilN
MAHINLLPWREELRKRRQKEFAVVAGVAVLLMLGIVLGVHLQFNSMIEHQENRNGFLKKEISKLDQKIKAIKGLEAERRRLLARMNIIQELQASRPEVVHLFDELVTTLPEGVFFTKAEQKGRNITIHGLAQSNARVSSLMRNMDKSQWLKDPRLVEIKAQPKGKAQDALRLSEFRLRIKQDAPKAGKGNSPGGKQGKGKKKG